MVLIVKGFPIYKERSDYINRGHRGIPLGAGQYDAGGDKAISPIFLLKNRGFVNTTVLARTILLITFLPLFLTRLLL